MNKRKGLIAVTSSMLVAALIAVGVVVVGGSAAQAAIIPSPYGAIDEASDVFYWSSPTIDQEANMLAESSSHISPEFIQTTCINAASPNVYLGSAAAQAALAPGLKGISSILNTVIPASAYNNPARIAEFDFMSLPCASDWALNGNWVLVADSGTTSGSSTTIPVSLADVTINPDGSGSSDPAAYYLQRADGSWVHGAVSPIWVAIAPAPQTHETALGEPITLSLADLAENCTVSTGEACNPDTIAFSDLPSGAVINGNSFTWTPSTLDAVNFTFVLTDSVSGTFSAATVGTITVTDVPAEPTPEVVPPVVTEPTPAPAPKPVVTG